MNRRILLICILVLIITFIKAHSASEKNGEPVVTPAGTILKSWEHHQKLKNESIFQHLSWRSIGPVSQGGRIESIVAIPGDSSVMYIGVGSGGVWKTTNGGTTWFSIFDDQPTNAIGDIEICTSDPDILWVGTGESLLSKTSFPGVGIFKTVNGGKTFKNMGLIDTHHIMRIAIDQNNPDIVFVAAMGHAKSPNKERGIYKTINGGKTWERILFINENTGASDVIIDPANSNHIFAAVWNREDGLHSGIYRSINGGETWIRLDNGFINSKKTGIIGLDISLTNPKKIYAVVDNRDSRETEKQKKITGLTLKKIKSLSKSQFLGMDEKKLDSFFTKYEINYTYGIKEIKKLIRDEKFTPESLINCIEKYWQDEPYRPVKGCEIYRSDDHGNNWKKVNRDPIYIYANHGWSFGDIKVSPVNENEIYILGVTLQKSTDGGRTFNEIRGDVTHLVENTSVALHLDMHDLWIDPMNPGRLLLGNDGGVFTSLDDGKNWIHHNTLPLAEFYTISIDMKKPYFVYGGTQDNSSLFGPSDNDVVQNRKDPWSYVWLDRWSGGDGFYTFVDPSNSDIVFFESQNGWMVRKNMKTNVSKSIRPKREICEYPLRFNWATPFKQSIYDPDILYCAGNRIYKSFNKGDDWIAISPDLFFLEGSVKNPKGVFTILSESPLNKDILIAGGNKGEIFITKDGGESWEHADKGIPDHLKVSSIFPSKFSNKRVYLTLNDYNHDDANSYIFISNDLCKTWISISNNLPVEAVNVIAEDPEDENILYTGTDLGVYVSFNKGDTWISLCNNLPPIPVLDILVHPRDNELVIGTHGRSAYVLDISPIRKLAKNENPDIPKLFDIKSARLPRKRHSRNDWDMETLRKAKFTFYLPETGKVKIVVTTKDDKIAWGYEHTFEKGVQLVEWDMIKEKSDFNRSAYFSGTKFFKEGVYKVKFQSGEIIINRKFEIKSFK